MIGIQTLATELGQHMGVAIKVLKERVHDYGNERVKFRCMIVGRCELFFWQSSTLTRTRDKEVQQRDFV